MSSEKKDVASFEELGALARKTLDLLLVVQPYIPIQLQWINTNDPVGNAPVTLGKVAVANLIDEIAEAIGVKLVRLNEDGCMWDPETGGGARPGSKHNAETKAVLFIGARGDRVCEDCASKPPFKRARKRVSIYGDCSQ